MEKFIPFQKLSKKQKRAFNAKRREVWQMSPVTRKPKNPKAYDRQKARKWNFDDSSSVLFCFFENK